MKFFDMFKKDDGIKSEDEFDVGKTPVKVIEVGSSGTEIFAGTLSEEYLQELQGQQGAEVFDKMRRSDPKVKMILSAMKNPIKSAVWEVHQKGDETHEGEIQQKFIEHILFDDLGKTWKSFLHEALSCIDFGYSLFEITYKAELNHPVWGSYNGIRSLAFRSQKTISRWDINKHGELDTVEQQAFGDHQKVTKIPAKYLLHFALEKEGDNFEGVSVLRPCYGPWLRKNTFLKLIAAGTEKYAIPIPILKIPEGKQDSQEYRKAIQALQKYVSHQCNYLTIPYGWDLELKSNPFDASKIRGVINEENVEMVNAALANFLELGQSGSGSYALSFDLSDFFLGGLEYIAEQITETINGQLIPKLIELNFPGQKPLVELHASGIADRAGEELAKIVDMLVKSGVVKADDRLEESLRKRFGLPARDDETSRELKAEKPMQFAEKKNDLKKKSKDDKVIKQIESDAEVLKELMREHLGELSSIMIGQAVKHWKNATPAQKVKAPKDLKPIGLAKYQKALTNEISKQYLAALDQAKKENPRFSNIKLSETEERILLGEFDRINRKGRNRILGLVNTLVTAHAADIEKNIRLQYVQSSESTDSPRQLEQDLSDATNKTINGPMTTAGSIINASTITNFARKDLFDEIVKTKEVESFTWVNSSPVSEICKGINGMTLPADHPDVDRYWPPLHHNCKTYVVLNTSNRKDKPTPQNGFTPTEAQKKSITLAD